MATLNLVSLTTGIPNGGRPNSAEFNNGTLLLTKVGEGGDNAGSAFSEQIGLKNDTSFNAQFQFQTSAVGEPEGFTFIIHNDPSGQAALGGSAPGLGYRPFTLRGEDEFKITNALVIEFDTFSNTSGQLFDGIEDVDSGLGGGGNSIEIVLVDGDGNRIFGSAPGGFQTSFDDFDFNNGSVHTAWVDYDGLTQNLKVFLATGSNPSKPLTEAFSLNLSEQGTSLEEILGSANAYVGFTASTGGAPQSHQILSFDFLSTPAIVDPDPIDPDPIAPDPIDPDPIDPDPIDPDPIDPDPIDPDPINPDPIDPDPINPDPIAPDPENPPGTLAVTGENLLKLNGATEPKTAKFSTVKASQTGAVEVGILAVDNAGGTIDGVAPDSDGYIATALPKAKTIFSTLGDLDFQSLDFDRSLSLDPNSFYVLFVVQNGTIDSILNGGSGNLIIGSPLFKQNSYQSLKPDFIDELGAFEFSWDLNRDNKFDDFIFRIELPTDQPLALGSELQGNPESEVLDLRDLTGEVQLDLQVFREAANSNILGFYRVENTNGSVIDEFGNILNPGDKGYAQAAVRQWSGQPLIAPENGSTLSTRISVSGGQILVPFLITNGTLEQIIDASSSNDPAVFFPFLKANPGSTDHVKLLGDNTFGFEDIVGGGDFDYDDLIVKITVQSLSSIV